MSIFYTTCKNISKEGSQAIQIVETPNDICYARFPFSFQSWQVDDSYGSIVGVYGFVYSILFYSTI